MYCICHFQSEFYGKGIVTDVHEGGHFTVKWDDGMKERYRVGEGFNEVSLI